MHKEILSPEQAALLGVVKLFSNNFGLVGGTAIALHIGHRESIDYDLFTYDDFSNIKIKRKLAHVAKIERVLRDEIGQFTLLINGVHFTFFQYPYRINYIESFDHIIRIPDILTLAAMKAFALGRRAKWKDYVDLYFILKAHHTVSEITTHAKALFGNEFNEKIFRTQLAYFEDMNYAEQVIYQPGFAVPDETVKQALIAFSLT